MAWNRLFPSYSPIISPFLAIRSLTTGTPISTKRGASLITATMEAAAPKTATEPPVRVLVQTLTHLVPGTDGLERSFFILNLVCQHHWNCDFQTPKFRCSSYNDFFAFNNRRCFFLVDYGESQNDDDVPVLSYAWTGESL